MSGKAGRYSVVFMLVFSVFAIGFASAAPQDIVQQYLAPQEQPLLNAAMAYVGCRANFTDGFLNTVISTSPKTSSTLAPIVAKMQSDVAQLQIYANTGNQTNFNAYQRSTLTPDLAQAKVALQTALKAANLTNATRQSLRAAYNASLATYNTCNLNAAKTYASARVAFYASVISTLQNKTSLVAGKVHVDAGSITALLQNATRQVVTPLQNAVGAAQNVSQVSRALDSYCLFDGCPSGFNFHLDARFFLQGITTAFNYVKLLPGGINSTASSQVQSDLSSASTTLATVGSSAYASGQAQAIYASLQDAVHVLQTALFSLLRSLGAK